MSVARWVLLGAVVIGAVVAGALSLWVVAVVCFAVAVFAAPDGIFTAGGPGRDDAPFIGGDGGAGDGGGC